MKRSTKKTKECEDFERDHGAVVMAAPLGGMGAPHRPVLLQETLKYLVPERGGLFVDCTVGLGGHSEAILKSSPDSRILGLDLDPAALEYSRQRLAPFGERFRAVQANFRKIETVLSEAGEQTLPAYLSTLGCLHCSLIRRSVVSVFVSTLL